jgi:hypothetical protein
MTRARFENKVRFRDARFEAGRTEQSRDRERNIGSGKRADEEAVCREDMAGTFRGAGNARKEAAVDVIYRVRLTV